MSIKTGINNFKKKLPIKYKKTIKLKNDSKLESVVEITFLFLEIVVEFVSNLD